MLLLCLLCQDVVRQFERLYASVGPKTINPHLSLTDYSFNHNSTLVIHLKIAEEVDLSN